MLLSHQLDVKVLLLPDGDDPDSFAIYNTHCRQSDQQKQRYIGQYLVALPSLSPGLPLLLQFILPIIHLYS